MNNSTQRFSDRVGNYVRYRPSYPTSLIATLKDRARLTPQSPVADIGSGTGILTALLLPLAGRVDAVEPNAAMRAEAEARFRNEPNFRSIAAPAEATSLESASVDLITAGQAFHWFDARACRIEFARILKPGGHVALIWNERLTDATPFLADYEFLLRTLAREYDQLKQSRIDEAAIRDFFQPAPLEKIEFPNEQIFDLPGLIGRSLSSSYVPNAGQPGHARFLAELRRIFSAHARDGQVSLLYQTRLYLGRLT
jgi:SAM-dependent methyltransferase